MHGLVLEQVIEEASVCREKFARVLSLPSEGTHDYDLLLMTGASEICTSIGWCTSS